MPFYIDYTILDISLWVTFHMEGCQEDGVVFIDSVTVQDSDINIFDLLESSIADKIINYCLENLDKIIEDNQD